MTYKDIKVGNTVIVKKINGEDELKSKIMSMGITKGTPISIVSMAPMGCPLVVEVRGYNLFIRCSDAFNIDIY